MCSPKISCLSRHRPTHSVIRCRGVSSLFFWEGSNLHIVHVGSAGGMMASPSLPTLPTCLRICSVSASSIRAWCLFRWQWPVMKATTWEHISLGSLIMSNANCGSGPSGNQYLVCLCPSVFSQRLRHIWVAAASTSVYKIDLGGQGNPGLRQLGLWPWLLPCQRPRCL